MANINGPADWWANVPPDPNAKLSAEDMKKMRELCTTGAQGPDFPCKVCDKAGEFMVPGDGFYCKWHLPGDVEIQDI